MQSTAFAIIYISSIKFMIFTAIFGICKLKPKTSETEAETEASLDSDSFI